MTAPIASAGMIGPEATAAEQSRMELQARLNGLGGLNGRQLNPEAKAKKLREACEGFESIFIQKMWQEMRNAVPKTGLLSGREERFWQDMYDQELSKSMTKAGGIGLADMMYEQLSRNLVSASRSAAGVAQGAAFTPAAAPLVREVETESPLTEHKLAASIYDGEAPDTGAVTDAKSAIADAQPAVVATAQTTEHTVPVAAPIAQPAPLVAQTAEPEVKKTVQIESEHRKERKHIHKADLGQASGLLMAQKARRDAGDKLGSRAVRPSQRPPKEAEAQSAVATAPAAGVNQAGEFKPGSREALAAAMEMAKTGAVPAANASESLNLNEIVANVQAMNAAQINTQTVAAINPTAQTEEAEPVSRKVRFSTNVPKKAPNDKKAKQAIRMLNVDNVSAKSRQGKGLAAYHAQQEAAKATEQAAGTAHQPVQPAQPVAPLTAPLKADEAMAQAPIPPLTPQNQAANVGHPENFAIPPLTAADSRG